MNEREGKYMAKKKALNQNRRPSLSEWLSLKLDIPSDLVDGMRIELRGRHTLLLHGCCGILTYAPDEMRFRLTEADLCVTGERLVCHSYLAGAVGVEGKIDGLYLVEKGCADEKFPDKEASC